MLEFKAIKKKKEKSKANKLEENYKGTTSKELALHSYFPEI